jgi:hypothetical protein
VVFARDVPLTAQMRWLECDLLPGERYRLRALVDGGSGTGENAALLHFDMPAGAAGGTGVSVSRALGAHTFLRTGGGLHRTDRVLSIRGRVRRMGLLAAAGADSAVLRALTIERVSPLKRPADIFLSFDVEAAPERTAADRIDRLVWGRFGGHEYGISRICRILEEYGLIGNFMIDFVTCAIQGDAALQAIIDHLRGRGHEVHLHLHPEYLDPSLGYVLNGHPVQMDRTPFDMSTSLLELALENYTRFVGKGPYVFRAGGYRVNDHAVRAAGEVGIHALTNVKPHTIGDVASGGDEIPNREPFVWDNGVIEIPVDASSPEVSQFRTYVERYREALARKSAYPTFNVVMHSWSLTRRNGEGHHDSPAPEHEDRFRQICEHAARHGRVRGYAEYIGSLAPRQLPVRRVAQIRVAQRRGQVTCTICDARFEGPDVAGGRCPSCGLGVAHRQVRFALDEYGDIFAGRQILGLDLAPAESGALLGAASTVDGTDESCDGVLWIGDAGRPPDIARVVSLVGRILRPGGFLAFPGPADSGGTETTASAMSSAWRSSEDGLAALRARHFVMTRLPAVDPVTKSTGVVVLAYRPGGGVALRSRPEWILRLRSLGLRLPSVFHLGVGYVRGRAAQRLSPRAKRALRRAAAVPGRGVRLVRRMVKGAV